MPTKILMNGRVLTATVMLAIFTIMSLLALDFPSKARLMPMLIGIPASLLALVQLIIEYRAVLRESAGAVNSTSPGIEDKSDNKGENVMFLWVFLFFIGILCFGFIYAAPVLVFGFLYYGSKESLKVSLISSACTWSLMYIVFVEWFKITLFPGLIPEWLFG